MRKSWLGSALVLAAAAIILTSERGQPLRRQTRPVLRRGARNMALAGISAVALRVLEKPLVQPLSQLVERRSLGLVRRLKLPKIAETALVIALLDYTLYLWHVFTHKSPFLWRFHVVHHCDLDLDASTALRFHFGEMSLSVPYRAAQVLVIGAGPRQLSTWQNLTIISILFHHSNWRLPVWLERRLSSLIVTPRMHGIHHSIVEDESNSNWSSGLTLWDRIHGTLKLDIPQDEITIGVARFRSPEDVRLTKLVRMPFEKHPPTNLLPSGERPRRAPRGQ